MNETVAITNAITGKKGYIGTLKGRFNCGSFFLSWMKAIMDTMYSVRAPNTAIMMISDVFPVSKVMMPMLIFTSNALEGV